MTAPIAQIGAAATLTWNSLLLEVKKVTIGAYGTDPQDTTVLSAPAHTFIGSLPKPEPWTLTFNYDTEATNLRTLFAAVGGVAEAFTLTFHGGGTATGNAYIGSFEISEINVDNVIEVDVQLVPSGQIVLAS